MVADLFEHLAELAVTAFNEDDLEPRVVAASGSTSALIADFTGIKATDLCGSGLHARGSGLDAIDRDAFAEALEGFFGGLATDLHEVRLLHIGSGARELVGQFAVVGDEQQAFAQVVEAANGIEALLDLREELHDRGTAFGIADSCDESLWLVEHVVAMAFGALQELAVNPDVIAGGVGLCAELGDNLSVDLHAALRDEFFGVAAAGDAGLGKYLLKAFEFPCGLRLAVLFFKRLDRKGTASWNTVGGLLEGVTGRSCCGRIGLESVIFRGFGFETGRLGLI
jgi:hypothetical protein